MMEQSRQRIMLADSTKFGRTASYRLGSVEDVTDVITNASPCFDDPRWSEYRKIMTFVNI